MKIISKTLFVIGILLAMALAVFFPESPKVFGIPMIMGLVIMMGLIIGIMNIRGTKTNSFLITTITLLILGNAGLVVAETNLYSGMMLNALAFIGPAAVLVFIKAIVEMVKVY